MSDLVLQMLVGVGAIGKSNNVYPVRIVVLVVIVFVLASTLLVVWLSIKKLRGLAQEREAKFRAQANLVLFDGFANFIGQRSRTFRLRGNGALALLDDKLVFEMYLPERRIEIPLNRIVSVSSTRWFKGRFTFTPILIVEFEDESGRDAVGFYVRNVNAWLEALQMRT